MVRFNEIGVQRIIITRVGQSCLVNYFHCLHRKILELQTENSNVYSYGNTTVEITIISVVES